MEILLEKNESLSANIKVKLQASDFQPRIDKKIKEVQRKAVLKGFRQGKVPMPLIKKMYGRSVMVEEINTLATESLNTYLEESKLDLVNAPVLDVENHPNFDDEQLQEVVFNFAVGFKPQLQVSEFLATIRSQEVSVQLSEQDLDEEIKRIQQTYADFSTPETSEAQDTLIGRIQKDDSTSVITIEIADIDADKQSIFVGLKEGDSISINVDEIFADKKNDVIKDNAQAFEGECQIQINYLGRKSLAPLDEAFFKKVLGEDAPSTLEEFREQVKETLTSIYEEEMKQLQIKELEEQITKIEVDFPTDFYKKAILLNSLNEGKMPTSEDLEKAVESIKPYFAQRFFREAVFTTYEPAPAQKEEIDNFIGKQIRHRFFFMGVFRPNNFYSEQLADMLRNSKDEKSRAMYREYLEAFEERKLLETISPYIQLEQKSVDLAGYKNIIQEFNKKHQTQQQ